MRGSWIPQHALGGHFGAVVDLAWSFDGGCLLSASTDQTARIITADPDGHWFEIARPQVESSMRSSSWNACRSSVWTPLEEGTALSCIDGAILKTTLLLNDPGGSMAQTLGTEQATKEAKASGDLKEGAHGHTGAWSRLLLRGQPAAVIWQALYVRQRVGGEGHPRP